MGGVTVQHGAVPVGDLPRVVEHDHLGGEVCHTAGGLVLGVGGHIASLDVLDKVPLIKISQFVFNFLILYKIKVSQYVSYLNRHALDIEANVVPGHGLGQRLVVHLDRLDLGGQLVWGEGDHHAGLDDPSLHSAQGNCPNASNFVDIL